MRPSIRPVVHALVVALASCATGTSVPRGVTHALRDPDAAAAVRVLIEADRIVAWVVPTDLEFLPPAVRRAAAAVTPDGHTEFVGRVFAADGEMRFVVEKSYGDGIYRGATIADDGTILSRSHSIPLTEAPPPVQVTIGAERGPGPSRFEFVQLGPEVGWYRARFEHVGGRGFVIELNPDGSLRRSTAIRPAEVRASG